VGWAETFQLLEHSRASPAPLTTITAGNGQFLTVETKLKHWWKAVEQFTLDLKAIKDLYGWTLFRLTLDGQKFLVSRRV